MARVTIDTMGGCTNCAAKTGCSDRKGTMFAAVDAALARLYPSKTWGEPDDLARFDAGIDEADGQALADELAIALSASTFYRPGDEHEYCDYIYVLCVGREPCLVQLRDGQVAIPDELANLGPNTGESISEQYLRVCLSQMTRMAGVQQAAMTLEAIEDGYLIREQPRSGVYDAPLLKRFQRLVSLLPAYDITHLDFGEISDPPAGFSAGEYQRLYGGQPDTANYVFFPQPSNMQQVSFLSA